MQLLGAKTNHGAGKLRCCSYIGKSTDFVNGCHDAQMERDDPEALKRVSQAAIARHRAAMAPKKAADPKPLEPLGLEVPGAPSDRDLDGEQAAVWV